MTDGCRVDFYVLEHASQSETALTCRLALMAWEQGFRTLVLAPDLDSAEALDEQMWSQPAGRFLPHSPADAPLADQAPVWISYPGQACNYPHDVVINLSNELVNAPQTLSRVLEIVPASEDRKQSSRDKFRQYRELGLEPVSHEIKRA